ncbi:MAG: hypothetical protein U0136_02275 [Bdellovibrionota bacterium]
MNKELIPHVFASVQSLERYVQNIRSLIGDSSSEHESIRAACPDFERVVKQMRRVANKLQFEVAADDNAAIVRSLQIFYGLNHMVRPEVITAFLTLTRGKEARDNSSVTIGGQPAGSVH